MTVTATQFKQNLGAYLDAVSDEDIYITKHGRVIAVLSHPHKDRIAIAKSLIGSLPNDITLEEAREERLSRI